jgi:hypothetical protein
MREENVLAITFFAQIFQGVLLDGAQAENPAVKFCRVVGIFYQQLKSEVA